MAVKPALALALIGLAGAFQPGSAATEDLPCRNYRSASDCAKLKRNEPEAVTPSLAATQTEGVTKLERIIVEPQPEDLEPPQPTRWQKFVRALGPDPRLKRTETETRFNDGTRMTCYSPCEYDCCVVVVAEPFNLARPTKGGM